MRSLSSELAPHLPRLSREPRVYADANVPARLVDFMRHRLKWDVLFVVEHDDLRRARDAEHFELARQLRRTLLTLDRDYLDERRFPTARSGGVIVIAAPDERGFIKLLRRIDRFVFKRPPAAAADNDAGLPLAGRKVDAHVGWSGRTE